MGKIFIICPECRRKLSFNEVPGYQNMIVECPMCHFKANASGFPKSSQLRPTCVTDDIPTELVFAPSTSVDAGQIRVLSTDEVYYLKVGSQVIGRKAETGTADIKISNDMYMSRRHVQIDVVKRPIGYEHRLVEIGSTNQLKLNDEPVNRGEILRIKFGDIITLGETKIRLESNSGEDTRIQ